MRKKYSKADLRRMFFVQRLKERDIAMKLSISQPMVHYLLKKFGFRREKFRYVLHIRQTKNLAYLVGAITGDGHIAKTNKEHNLIQLSSTDKEFAEEIGVCFQKLLKKSKPSKTNIFNRTDRFRTKPRYVVNCSSHDLWNWFRTDFREKTFKLCNRFSADFIRGFFDAEGGTSFITAKRSFVVHASNKDLELLFLIKKIMEEKFNIHSLIKISHKKGSICSDGSIRNFDNFQLLIYRLEDVMRYHDKIGFTIPRKKLCQTTLKIDVDLRAPKQWRKAYCSFVRAGLAEQKIHVNDITMRSSSSRRGFHAFIDITTFALNDKRKNMLQFLCRDCLTRVWINVQRIEKSIEAWNKLFSTVPWKSEPKEPCKSCVAIAILGCRRRGLRKQCLNCRVFRGMAEHFKTRIKKYPEAKAGVYL